VYPHDLFPIELSSDPIRILATFGENDHDRA
jgi:hypothetical protein